jgi:hypothetical protein
VCPWLFRFRHRGAFLSVKASLHQFSGGAASSVAGLIVVQASDGHLLH